MHIEINKAVAYNIRQFSFVSSFSTTSSSSAASFSASSRTDEDGAFTCSIHKSLLRKKTHSLSTRNAKKKSANNNKIIFIFESRDGNGASSNSVFISGNVLVTQTTQNAIAALIPKQNDRLSNTLP
mmetsp:Transcript_25205/g.37589  ORF Transcript_25205/g.37589 Transcript_25205/m.37589 type:complete len:126 (-) Transcript_25205:645-1022(-)